MYNSAHIEKFIEKVNAEANKAAQDVFDKHNDELIRMIKNQLRPGDTISCGMGVVSLVRKGEVVFDNKFANALSGTQYGLETDANFSLDIIVK